MNVPVVTVQKKRKVEKMAVKVFGFFNFMENMTLISDIMNNFTVLSELYTMNVYITQHFIHLMRFY